MGESLVGSCSVIWFPGGVCIVIAFSDRYSQGKFWLAWGRGLLYRYLSGVRGRAGLILAALSDRFCRGCA
jgi:hypothetical protein